MARTGRPTKPRAQKQVEGTYRKDRDRGTPDLDVAAPEKPTWLGEIASQTWDELVPLGLKMRVITPADGLALAVACQAVERWRLAEQLIAKDGMTFVTPNGYVALHPAVAVAQKAAEQARAMLGEFGMTPASRTKADMVPEREEADPVQRLMRKREAKAHEARPN